MPGHNRKGRSRYGQKFVALYEPMQRTKAWRDLDCKARCAYVELARRYNGGNNGRIGYSVRQMAKNLNASQTTAMRVFRVLQEHGFIVRTKKGGFSLKLRHASEYRLTEYKCDQSGRLATHDYRDWGK